MPKTFKVYIKGQVQGVGFRPFVHNLAYQLGIKGTVCNDGNGVLIHANGKQREIMVFMDNISEKAPETAIIQSSSMEESELMEFNGFSIVPSEKNNKVSIPLTADFAICPSCKREIQDVENRRFGYPFATCTQCGPRYALTERFPFERENTSLAKFTMCKMCLQEYEDPTDRRFHSQTNSCPDCGISTRLVDNSGNEVECKNISIPEKVSELLFQGAIVAVKNTNGYLLCADAGNTDTIKKLRIRKQRPSKPFALLYQSIERIKEDFEISVKEQQALTSKVCPIVILAPKRQTVGKIAEEVTLGLDRFGVMLPSSALLTLLTQKMQIPIVATSGNMHGSPILSTEEEATENLTSVADYFLHHNLDISFPQDDSVWQYVNDQRIILRRSRGMAPNFMDYARTSNKKVLAMGAHIKSTLAFTPNVNTYVSPYFGNLDNYGVLQRYMDTLQRYTQIFETFPELILVDAHPGYQSTVLGGELAGKWATPIIEVQHHKAHFASILAEHNRFDNENPILGVVWDGTGLGDDGMIWGGEFFIYDGRQMERLAHFEYYDSLAGDKMIKEPRLSLFALVDSKEVVCDKFSASELAIYQKLKKSNALKTSSVGRLFDAVASLLGLLDVNSYEGQAAMLLENCAWQYEDGYGLDLLEGTYFENVPSTKIIDKIIELKRNGKSKPYMAASFICTLAKAIVNMAIKYGTATVACSGGVFQNRFLVGKLMNLAKEYQLTLLFNKELSSNDENIALGQLAHYHNIIK